MEMELQKHKRYHDLYGCGVSTTGYMVRNFFIQAMPELYRIERNMYRRHLKRKWACINFINRQPWEREAI